MPRSTRVERIVCVGAFPGDGVQHADVVLPPTVWGEQHGSASNLEGRVQRLARIVTPEGATMESWRIAAELAVRLGDDFDLESADEVQDEIARVAPAFAGVDASLLRRARDGVLLPLADHLDELTLGPAPPGAGVSWEPIPLQPDERRRGRRRRPSRRRVEAPAPPIALHRWSADAPAPAAAPVDAYSLRLVAAATLYGADRVVAASPSLARLADDAARLFVNPRDLEALGVVDGDRVRATSARATIELSVTADRTTARGTTFIPKNRAGGGASDLVDVDAPATDLRVETIVTRSSPQILCCRATST